MPIVLVTYARSVDESSLERLAATLPHAVSLAVECPEEPYDGDLQPGDVDLRFVPRGPLDRGGLDITVEIRSKWFKSRARGRHRRCAAVRDHIVEILGPVDVGVYLSLPVAGWSQTND